MGKLRMAAQALAHLPIKKALNQWRSTWHEARAARAKLEDACSRIVSAQAGKAYRKWAEICAARNAQLAKMKAAVASFTPEGRAMKAALRKIAWVRKRHLAMQRALAGFRLSGCRRALRVMEEQVRLMAKLRRGGAAFFMRKTRACWNVWSEMAAKAANRNAKLSAALARMSPEGRALKSALSMWTELLEQVQQLRRAASGFINGSLKRAFTAWIENTFTVKAACLVPSFSHAALPLCRLSLAAIRTASAVPRVACACEVSSGHAACQARHRWSRAAYDSVAHFG